jgi:RecA-family ATPase
VTRELPVRRAADLEVETPSDHWLVEGLWGRKAVGIIGGPPKALKTFVGLDLALSVASGTPCLGRFAVKERGPALVYLAEDALPQVRARIEALAGGRGLLLQDLDLFVITTPVLRLDKEEHRQSLALTVRRLAPKLLLLDPLVRLHRLNENDSQEISGLLGHLRELNRAFHLAVVLVHHLGKKRRSDPGQALRGSSDLAAWTDSSIYLLRGHDGIRLTVEHRAAEAPAPLFLSLFTAPDGTARLDISEARQQMEHHDQDLSRAVLGLLEREGRPP